MIVRTLCVYSVIIVHFSSPLTPHRHRRQALLCLLAKNCNEAGYSRLVEALCNEHNIKLLKVSPAVLVYKYKVRVVWICK